MLDEEQQRYLSEALADGSVLVPDPVARLNEVFCGCGSPELVWQAILDRLEDSISDRWNLPVETGPEWILVYLLAHHGLTEHGASCRCSWLTDAGVVVRDFLRQYGSEWQESGDFVTSEGVTVGMPRA